VITRLHNSDILLSVLHYNHMQYLCSFRRKQPVGSQTNYHYNTTAEPNFGCAVNFNSNMTTTNLYRIMFLVSSLMFYFTMSGFPSKKVL